MDEFDPAAGVMRPPAPQLMSAPPTRLVLVRHGEAAANVDGRYSGSTDEPLTAHGAWQAAQLAAALAPLPITAVYSSPLRRAVATAEMIAVALGMTVRIDARLREAALGEWEGLSHAAVRARSAADAELLARWYTDPHCTPPGGESLHAVQTRMLDLVRDLTAAFPGAWLALVSHVGPIKGLIYAALQAPLPGVQHLWLDPATVSVVDWSSHPVVRLVNAHGHLGWTTARWMRMDALAPARPAG
ncbi:MAG TPA: histidine phosphatase family protein [Roseiflexaceae bacterium]